MENGNRILKVFYLFIIINSFAFPTKDFILCIEMTYKPNTYVSASANLFKISISITFPEASPSLFIIAKTKKLPHRTVFQAHYKIHHPYFSFGLTGIKMIKLFAYNNDDGTRCSVDGVVVLK